MADVSRFRRQRGCAVPLTHKVVDGTMPASAGTASLFIDWYGPGGGVKPECHTVGVGYCGVGRR